MTLKSLISSALFIFLIQLCMGQTKSNLVINETVLNSIKKQLKINSLDCTKENHAYIDCITRKQDTLKNGIVFKMIPYLEAKSVITTYRNTLKKDGAFTFLRDSNYEILDAAGYPYHNVLLVKAKNQFKVIEHMKKDNEYCAICDKTVVKELKKLHTLIALDPIAIEANSYTAEIVKFPENFKSIVQKLYKLCPLFLEQDQLNNWTVDDRINRYKRNKAIVLEWD